MREIRQRTENGATVLDIEIERNEELVGMLKSVAPGEVAIHSKQTVSAGSTDIVPTNQAAASHIQNRLFPSGLVPITIRGESYYLNGNYWSNKELLKSLNLLH